MIFNSKFLFHLGWAIIIPYRKAIPFRLDKGQTRAFSLVASRRARLYVTTVLDPKVRIELTTSLLDGGSSPTELLRYLLLVHLQGFEPGTH